MNLFTLALRIFVLFGCFSSCFCNSGSQFQIVSYNILNHKYLDKRLYPSLDLEKFSWETRRLNLLKMMRLSEADVICLQEIDADSHEYFLGQMSPLGYSGAFAKKGTGFDGVGTYYKNETLTWIGEESYLCNGTSRCGKKAMQPALVLSFLLPSGRLLSIINTKIRWQPEYLLEKGDPAWNQVHYLLKKVINPLSDRSWIIAGDFNLLESNPLIQEFMQAGFRDAYSEIESPTCYANGETKRIDYIWHSACLKSKAIPLRPLSSQSPLPNAFEPSDHLAIGAILWEAE